MTDPTALLDGIEAAEDAFNHALGKPTFEPGLDATPNAEPGEVPIQKACRLLELTSELESLGDYYRLLHRCSPPIRSTDDERSDPRTTPRLGGGTDDHPHGPPWRTRRRGR